MRSESFKAWPRQKRLRDEDAFARGDSAAKAIPELAGRLLTQVLDRVNLPLALCISSGHIVHQNPSLSRAVALDVDQLPAMIRTVAHTVASCVDRRSTSATATPNVCKQHGQWSVIGSALECEFRGSMPTVLVSLVRRNAEAPGPESDVDPGQLQKAYRLTRRQCEVLEFLRRRRSNNEIARTLEISEHTARHHTETVLAKLGLHSRADVEELCARLERLHLAEAAARGEAGR